MVKQNYPPPHPPGPSPPKNRQIREFKMQREHKKSSRFRKQIDNFVPAYLVLISDSQGRSAFVVVVYKNKLLAKETDR